MKVNFYSCEVKYSGKASEYTKEQFLNMALERTYNGVDAFEFSKDLCPAVANELDGDVFVEFFPCNHIARVNWSYAEDESENIED